ncbi:MAG: hypothetical protein FDZ75_04955 [Actinobacteria bacterium]|nr:MAG: hypothetical protein FDZ75_04955 [Actinomycetota bacterium]
MKRAHSPRSLGGFLPWPWLQLGPLGLVKPMIKVRSVLSAIGMNVDRYFMPSWTAPAKATVAAAIVVAAVTPVAVTHAPVSPASVTPRTARTAIQRSAGWNGDTSTWRSGSRERGAWSPSAARDAGWSMNSRYGEFAPHTWSTRSWSSTQDAWSKGDQMSSGSTKKWSPRPSSSSSWSSGTRPKPSPSAPSSGSWSGGGASSGWGSNDMGSSGSWSGGGSGSGSMGDGR